ncbi:MAG: hypothetical protein CVU20_09375 [Betaproteobacteria bacterium HGW-Betaproteobacteria-14]|nr:MAG: hypothetical protein CVU20_09375 [Betaproteobacteria bacterium HGW-Betaproteobacteria-14]
MTRKRPLVSSTNHPDVLHMFELMDQLRKPRAAAHITEADNLGKPLAGSFDVEHSREPPTEISDDLWSRISLLLRAPEPQASNRKRKPGGGRKRGDPRAVFEGIVYVLRTGTAWKKIPRDRFASGSTLHLRFQEWISDGLFHRIWKTGLAEHPDLQGICWRCHHHQQFGSSECQGGVQWTPAFRQSTVRN